MRDSSFWFLNYQLGQLNSDLGSLRTWTAELGPWFSESFANCSDAWLSLSQTMRQFSWTFYFCGYQGSRHVCPGFEIDQGAIHSLCCKPAASDKTLGMSVNFSCISRNTWALRSDFIFSRASSDYFTFCFNLVNVILTRSLSLLVELSKTKIKSHITLMNCLRLGVRWWYGARS